MEKYRHTGEEPLNRRQFVKRVANGLAILTGGYYGGDILVGLSEQSKTLSEVRKSTRSIDDAYIKVKQYNACQSITTNRCEEIMSPDTLAEVMEAQTVVEQHKMHVEEVNRQIERDNKRIDQDILKTSLIGAVVFITNKLPKYLQKN